MRPNRIYDPPSIIEFVGIDFLPSRSPLSLSLSSTLSRTANSIVQLQFKYVQSTVRSPRSELPQWVQRSGTCATTIGPTWAGRSRYDISGATHPEKPMRCESERAPSARRWLVSARQHDHRGPPTRHCGCRHLGPPPPLSPPRGSLMSPPLQYVRRSRLATRRATLTTS